MNLLTIWANPNGHMALFALFDDLKEQKTNSCVLAARRHCQTVESSCFGGRPGCHNDFRNIPKPPSQGARSRRNNAGPGCLCLVSSRLLCFGTIASSSSNIRIYVKNGPYLEHNSSGQARDAKLPVLSSPASCSLLVA